jgi:aminopeptidase N
MLTDRNKICRLVLVCLLLFMTCDVLSQRVERTIVDWQPTHYSVAVVLNDSLTEISAVTDIDLRVLNGGLSRLEVQFGDLNVDSIKMGATNLSFERKPGLIVIALPGTAKKGSKMKVSISYHGIPKDGLILTKDKEGIQSATGDNWPDRVHNWIPCIDHPSAKASVTFTINAPERDYAVANGQLVSRQTNANKTVTWTYDEKAPIPPYCMVIAVDNFDVTGPPSRKSLSYLVPHSDHELAGEFAPSEQMLDYFSELIAPYPYEKLALIVGATQFGGMENSGAIVFPSNFLRRNGNEALTKAFRIPMHVEETTAHEIAHQWFGDSVTESTWADLWLSEGFATYFAGLFLEHYEGREIFNEYMRRQKVVYLGYEKQNPSPIHDTQTTDLFRLLNANNYQKGAWVLHMLRGMLGDEKFYEGLRIYYRNHINSNANSDDLRVALEKSGGRNLKDFFDRWVYESGHPVFEVVWSTKTEGGRNFLSLEINQVQHNSAFLMPLTILVKTDRGEIRKTIELTGKRVQGKFPLESKAVEVMVDPDAFVLAETTVRHL